MLAKSRQRRSAQRLVAELKPDVLVWICPCPAAAASALERILARARRPGADRLRPHRPLTAESRPPGRRRQLPVQAQFHRTNCCAPWPSSLHRPATSTTLAAQLPPRRAEHPAEALTDKGNSHVFATARLGPLGGPVAKHLPPQPQHRRHPRTASSEARHQNAWPDWR